MTTNIPRTSFMSFLNTTPSTTATYSRIGDGVSDAALELNPKITTEQYIDQDVPTSSLESYEPKFPVEMKAKKGDAVFEYVFGLLKTLAVGADALSDVVFVWYHETPTLGEYPAMKIPVTVAVEKYGGAGDESNKFSYSLSSAGDNVIGTFNPTTKVFTPNPNVAEGLSALTIGSLTLTPTFDRDILFYTATTSSSPQTGTATAEDETATVLLKNGGTTIDTDTGEATGSITLATGVNTITAKVTIGSINNTYTVAVTKTA